VRRGQGRPAHEPFTGRASWPYPHSGTVGSQLCRQNQARHLALLMATYDPGTARASWAFDDLTPRRETVHGRGQFGSGRIIAATTRKSLGP
jgi:hypothetical protein